MAQEPLFNQYRYLMGNNRTGGQSPYRQPASKQPAYPPSQFQKPPSKASGSGQKPPGAVTGPGQQPADPLKAMGFPSLTQIFLGGAAGVGVSQGFNWFFNSRDENSLAIKLAKGIDGLPGVRSLSGWINRTFYDPYVIKGGAAAQTFFNELSSRELNKNLIEHRVSAMKNYIPAPLHQELSKVETQGEFDDVLKTYGVALNENKGFYVPGNERLYTLIDSHTIGQGMNPELESLLKTYVAEARSPFWKVKGPEQAIKKLQQAVGNAEGVLSRKNPLADEALKNKIKQLADKKTLTQSEVVNVLKDTIQYQTNADDIRDIFFKVFPEQFQAMRLKPWAPWSGLNLEEKVVNAVIKHPIPENQQPLVKKYVKKLAKVNSRIHRNQKFNSFEEIKNLLDQAPSAESKAIFGKLKQEYTASVLKHLQLARFNTLSILKGFAEKYKEESHLIANASKADVGPIGKALLNTTFFIRHVFGGASLTEMFHNTGNKSWMDSLTKHMGGFIVGVFTFGFALHDMHEAKKKEDKTRTFFYSILGSGLGSFMGWELGTQLLEKTELFSRRIPNGLGWLGAHLGLRHIPLFGKSVFTSGENFLRKAPLSFLERSLGRVPLLGELAKGTWGDLGVLFVSTAIFGVLFQKAGERLSCRLFGKPQKAVDEEEAKEKAKHPLAYLPAKAAKSHLHPSYRRSAPAAVASLAVPATPAAFTAYAMSKSAASSAALQNTLNMPTPFQRMISQAHQHSFPGAMPLSEPSASRTGEAHAQEGGKDKKEVEDKLVPQFTPEELAIAMRSPARERYDKMAERINEAVEEENEESEHMPHRQILKELGGEEEEKKKFFFF